jgi:hypothetical protein
MPDAAGNIKGIVLSGKAGETLEKIKQEKAFKRECECLCHKSDWIGTPGCWCRC